MSVKPWFAAIGVALLALGNASLSVAQTPTPQQIQAFKSLPAAEQQALLQRYAGGAAPTVVVPGGLNQGPNKSPVKTSPPPKPKPKPPAGGAATEPFGYNLFTNPASTFAPVSNVPVPPNYVVGPGDTFDVQLYGNEAGNYVLGVDRNGQIDFPKLGPITVSGMGFDSARRVIEERVAQQLIGTQVNVTMGTLRTIRVFVLGEVQQPGSYTVGGLATMTNALFASGGVKTTGSLRRIELKRNGQLVSTLDLYDLLLHGDTSGDHRLQQGDVIFVPPIGPTVSIDGAVLRPAIYELKSATTLEQMVRIAGGLLPDADQRRVSIERILPSRLYETVNFDLLNRPGRDAKVENGDRIHIATIRPTLEKSVQLVGDVYRPGDFAYRPGLRLSDVLPTFKELKPTADPHYIMIRRIIPPAHRIEVLSADLSRALTERGTAADPLLEPQDKIYVFDLTSSRASSIAPILQKLELQATPQQPAAIVGIEGQVKAPGRYPLEPGMRVSDLIRAGGSLDDAAYGGEAELVRYRVVGGKIRRTRIVNIDLAAAVRGVASADLALRPYDVLLVKRIPDWKTPGSVDISGEVRFPGTYPIQRGETLRSLLMRAGGLADDAFPEGAVFTRTELRSQEKAQLDLLAKRFQAELSAATLQSVRAGATGTAAGAAVAASAPQNLAIGQEVVRELRTTQPVGRLVIHLTRLMREPVGGPDDVVLQNGDRLFVPKLAQEVMLIGEVQNPTALLYHPGWSRNDYINRSGGLTRNADRKRIYVVRADGEVVGGERVGWFRRAQSVDMRPGDTVVVPMNPDRIPALPLWTSATTILYNIAIAILALKGL